MVKICFKDIGCFTSGHYLLGSNGTISNRPLARLWECSQINLEDKTKEIFASVKKTLLFCTPDLAAFPQTCKGSISCRQTDRQTDRQKDCRKTVFAS